jgi:hypothetical protein
MILRLVVGVTGPAAIVRKNDSSTNSLRSTEDLSGAGTNGLAGGMTVGATALGAVDESASFRAEIWLVVPAFTETGRTSVRWM